MIIVKCSFGHETGYRKEPPLRNGNPVCPVCKRSAEFVKEPVEKPAPKKTAPKTDKVAAKAPVEKSDENEEGGSSK